MTVPVTVAVDWPETEGRKPAIIRLIDAARLTAVRWNDALALLWKGCGSIFSDFITCTSLVVLSAFKAANSKSLTLR